MNQDPSLSQLAGWAMALAEQAEAGAPPLGGFAPAMLDESADVDGTPALVDPYLGAEERWALFLGQRGRLGDAPLVPPELGVGDEPTHAADVFSLGAMAYRTIVQRNPTGSLDGAALNRTLGPRAGALVLRALHAECMARPSLSQLSEALDPGLAAAAAGAVSGAMPPDSRRHEPSFDPEQAREQRKRSFLQPLLLVGSISVFIGALWFIWLSWGSLSDAVRLLMIGGLTAAVGGFSVLLDRTGFSEASATFRVLATQLLWAVGGFLLLIGGVIDSGFGWAAVGISVAGVAAVVGRTKGPKVVLFPLAGIAVAVAAISLYISFGGLGRVVFFAGIAVLLRFLESAAKRAELHPPAFVVGTGMLLAIYASCWHALWYIGEDVGMLVPALVCGAAWGLTRWMAHGRSSTTMALLAHGLGAPTALSLVALATETDGAFAPLWPALLLPVMSAFEHWLAQRSEDEAEADLAIAFGCSSLWLVGWAVAQGFGRVDSLEWALIGFATWAATVGLCLWKERRFSAPSSAVHFAVAAVFLGEHLSTGTWYGPMTWFLLVEISFLVLGLGAFRGRRHLGQAHLVGGAFVGLASTACALILVDGHAHALEGALFAYLPFVALLPLVVLGRDPVRKSVGWFGLVGVLWVPMLSMLIQPRWLLLAVVAAAWSLAVLALATCAPARGVFLHLFAEERSKEAADDDEDQTKVVRPPLVIDRTIGFWVGSGMAALVTLITFVQAAGHPIDQRFEWVALVAALSSTIFGLGLGGARLGHRREGRLAQLVGTVLYLGTFFLWSLGRPDEYGHASLVMLGGATLLFLGVKQRHRSVVFTAAGTLVMTFWIQFFAKLHDRAPLAVLLIAFGAAVLAFAIFYERRLKKIVSAVRSWPGI